MKTKTNFKILLVLGAIIVATLLFSFNIVQAADPTDTTLDLLGDTISVNVTEREFQSLDNTLSAHVLNLLLAEDSTLNISATGEAGKTQVRAYLDYSQGIHKATVDLGTYGAEIDQKTFNIEYSNTASYNTTDEQYVKSKTDSLNFHRWYADEVGEAVTWTGSYAWDTLINDNTIECVYLQGSGGGYSFWTSGSGGYVYLFKNDICYSQKEASVEVTRMVTIPDEIKENTEAYTVYALPKVKAALQSVSGNITIAPKVNNNNSGFDWEILVDGVVEDKVILKKANIVKIFDGITVNASLSNGVTVAGQQISGDNADYIAMTKELANRGYTNIFKGYELSLTGEHDGSLTLTFDVGTAHNGKYAYILHKKHDGSYEYFAEQVKEGKVTITVSELSPFVIALADSLESGTPKAEEKDKTPKMGIVDNTPYYLLGITAISALGIVCTKRKAKQA